MSVLGEGKEVETVSLQETLYLLDKPTPPHQAKLLKEARNQQATKWNYFEVKKKVLHFWFKDAVSCLQTLGKNRPLRMSLGGG